MSDRRGRRLARRGEQVAAALSLVAVAASVAWLDPAVAVAGGAVLVALTWAVVPYAIDAFLASTPAGRGIGPRRPESVTTIVCVGEEPRDVASATVVLAAAVGPVAIATTSDSEPFADLAPVDAAVFGAPTLDAALALAVAAVETHAVFVTSASAFPTNAVPTLAGALHGRVGWAVGRVERFSPDAFAPGERDEHAARLRSRARGAGLEVWEPDATVVRTDLLRVATSGRGRPRGAWLRTFAARGYERVEVESVVARRAAPTDGPLFWPSAVMRARGVTADLVDATRSGPWRARLLALAGIARELAAYRLALWLCIPLLVAWGGAFPFRVGLLPFVALHASLAIVRWATARAAVGTSPHPARDAVAAIYDAPASLLALSALTGRIRPLRLRFPEQPLLVASIALTLAATVSLLDRPPTSDVRVDVAVGAAVVAVGTLWMCAVHAVGPRAWTRSSYRLALDAPARVDGRAARVRDASPSGAAVVGSFPEIHGGERVELSVSFPGRAAPVAMPATVVDHRRGLDDEAVLGLALELDGTTRAPWIAAVFEAAGVTATDVTATDAASPPPRHVRRRAPDVDLAAHGALRRVVRRVEVAVVAVISLALIAAVTLAVVGYRPLVVRSASMAPALEVGDVALVDWTRAADVGVGDVITFEAAEVADESVTHRVRSVTAADGVRYFETRGDANEESERWSTGSDELVGRVVARVPFVGQAVAEAGRFRGLLVAVTLAFGALAVVLATRRRRPPLRAAPAFAPRMET